MIRLLYVAVAVSICISFSLWLSYPGMVSYSWSLAQSATLPHLVDQLRFLRFWGSYMDLLTRDPETGKVVLGELPAGTGPLEQAKLALISGNLGWAIAKLREEIDASGESEEALFWLGLTHLRLAEIENCRGYVGSDGGSAGCALPLPRAHLLQTGARMATEAFQKLMTRFPHRNNSARWLLNFSALASGDFPDGVPAQFRPSERFLDLFYGRGATERRSRYSSLQFRECGASFGVGLLDCGKGVAVEDFDLDGFLDLVTGGNFEDLHFFRNIEGIRFEDRTDAVGLGGVLQPYIISAADYDNDGWMDLFVSRPFHRFQLFRNQRGAFVDVTEDAGLLSWLTPEQVSYTCTSAWGDFDNDGDLDLFLAQFGMRVPLLRGWIGRSPSGSRLFRNDGGRFRDVTDEYGLAAFVDDAIILGSAFGDYNRDGYQDLILSSYTPGGSVLLENLGGKGFRRDPRFKQPRSGFMAAFVDVNHDGLLDIFQGGNAASETATGGAYFDESMPPTHTLFMAGPEGFTDRPEAFHDAFGFPNMGAAFGDWDNDGCIDFYLGTGNPEPWSIYPNMAYLGLRDGSRCTGELENISMLEGLGTTQKGHGIVFFDLDKDGDEDLYSSLGGMWPGDRWPNQLFSNESQVWPSWVSIRLRGIRTNRFGVGATVRVTAVRPDGSKIVRFAEVDNGTGFGSAPYLAHVGLMDALKISEVLVYWPGSGTTRRYGASPGSDILLREDEGDLVGTGWAPEWELGRRP